MSFIAQIEKGEYTPNSSLKIQIENILEFILGENYILTGENGAGKSTFITKLLIPSILPNARNKFLLFYASQDFTIQYYVIKNYYNGLLWEKNDLTSIEKVILLIKSKYLEFEKFPTKNLIFIIDEIDQYIPLEKFLIDLNSKRISIFLATHNEDRFKSEIGFNWLQFEKLSSRTTKVSLEQ